jgi:hypothetical protein
MPGDEDGPAGYVEAAEVLSTRQDEWEEAEDVERILPDRFRVVELSKTAEFKIEKETTYGDRWVRIARFTEPDAKYEWAEDVASAVDGDYRCVVDKTENEVWLEVRIDE